MFTDCDICPNADITTPHCSTGELEMEVISRFIMMSDPGPQAAWHPALSSTGPGLGEGPLALSSGLTWTDEK